MHLSRNCPFSDKTNPHLELPGNKAIASKIFLMGISLSEYGSEGFRVRLRRLSEYGSYLVERPTRETQAEQYSDTILREL